MQLVLRPDNDPILRTKCIPVAKITKDLVSFSYHMLETMYIFEAVGLAAPQVGNDNQIIVVDCSQERNPKKAIIMFNPKIIWKSSKTVICGEGCLSLPGETVNVERSEVITTEFLDTFGNRRLLQSTGLESICIQHEVDHLNGILMTDYIS